MSLNSPFDGFWLPRSIREKVISAEIEYKSSAFLHGQPCKTDHPDAVTARWPILKRDQLTTILALLQGNRNRSPAGKAFWKRLEKAIDEVSQRLSNPSDPLRYKALNALPGYTGYSEPMIRYTLDSLDLIPLGNLPAAFDLSLTNRAAQEWQSMADTPGRIRFYPSGILSRSQGILPGLKNRPIFSPVGPVDLVLGYGAGNVPGTSLLIAFLAQATTIVNNNMLPAILIKNSRHEPLFTPLILSAIENIDPELVATTALLIWDYEDINIETFLLHQADLVIAAASDSTIAQIQGHIEEVSTPSHPVRFHAHGHKVSFSAVGAEVLTEGLVDPVSGRPMLDMITLLTALDSIFWDQNGCLSSRIHFIEKVTSKGYTA